LCCSKTYIKRLLSTELFIAGFLFGSQFLCSEKNPEISRAKKFAFASILKSSLRQQLGAAVSYKMNYFLFYSRFSKKLSYYPRTSGGRSRADGFAKCLK
jgi:hypothetical protein